MNFHLRRLDADGGTFECSRARPGRSRQRSPPSASAVGAHTLRSGRERGRHRRPDPRDLHRTGHGTLPTGHRRRTTDPGADHPDRSRHHRTPLAGACRPRRSSVLPRRGCTVPKLAGKTLGAAKAGAERRQCKLGHVTSPKVPKRHQAAEAGRQDLDAGRRSRSQRARSRSSSRRSPSAITTSIGPHAAVDGGHRKHRITAAAAAAGARRGCPLPGPRSAPLGRAAGRRADRARGPR